jgi:hypothetical protein
VKYLVLLSFIYSSFSNAAWLSSDTTDSEVKTWLKHADIVNTDLTKKQLDRYRDQVDKLKDVNYEVADDLAKQRIKVLLKQGLTCSGNDKIKVGKKLVSVYKYDKALMAALSESSDLSEDCKNITLREYMKFKYKQKDPLISRLCKKKPCPLIKKMKTIFEDNVASLIFDSYGTADKTAYCSARNKINKKTSISDLLESYERINKCTPLKMDEVKVMNGYLNGVTQKYSVEQKSSMSYKATFNIDFGNESITNEDGTVTSGNIMRDRINKCLDEANPHMKDASGRKMELSVIAPEEANKIAKYKRPPVINIGLKKEKSRANNLNYPVDITCGTIVHELLHLTGLFDEYEETAKGTYVHTETGEVIEHHSSSTQAPENRKEYEYTADFNHCRSIPQNNSIMGNHYTAYSHLIPKQGINCKCGTNNSYVGDKENPPDEIELERRRVDNESDRQKCIRRLNKISDKTKQLYASSYSIAKEHTIFRHRNSLAPPKCSIDGSKSEFNKVKSSTDLQRMKLFTKPIRADGKMTYTKSRFELLNDRGPLGLISKFTHSCDCSGDQQKNCDTYEQQINDVISNVNTAGTNYCPTGMTVTTSTEINREKGKYNFKRPSSAVKKDFLRPAHFERIIQGSCLEKTKKYIECGKYTYIKNNEECPERPNYCKDEALWLDSIE